MSQGFTGADSTYVCEMPFIELHVEEDLPLELQIEGKGRGDAAHVTLCVGKAENREVKTNHERLFVE